MDPARPRTPQQKNLDSKLFKDISDPIFDPDFADIGFEEVTDGDIDSNSDSEEKVDEKFYKRISISVAENMKMRDVLTQMANLAGVNIFIANDIDKSISFTANDRPFLDILRDVCSSCGLKYAISGNSVKIDADSPTLKFYRVSSLNLQRDTQSSVIISTDLFNGNTTASASNIGANASSNVGIAPGGSAANNGSNSAVSETSKNDFWVELENALKMIVGEADGSYVSVHKQGGIITAYATQNKHEEIKKYIKMLKESSEEQVLIEAKIIEVNLKDEYRSGINWQILQGGWASLSKPYTTAGNMITFGSSRADARALFAFMEQFGAVKTLSNPRVTILNNHSAVLKVAHNEVVYFPEYQKQYSGHNSENTTDLLSANIRTIPIGLIMKVQPSIDRKTNTVLLSLRPTISKVMESKSVPFLFSNYNAVGALNQALANGAKAKLSQPQAIEVPIVDVREVDSVLKVNSGQVVVMGGLMQEKSHNKRSGFPGVGGTPVDYVGGDRDRLTDVTELVIFLRATILRKKAKKYHNADERVYKKVFSSDPRQLNFKKN